MPDRNSTLEAKNTIKLLRVGFMVNRWMRVHSSVEQRSRITSARMNELQIYLQLPGERAAVCQRALALETKEEFMRRSRVKLEEFSQGMRILVRANDLPAMRAAVNTYLRWIIMCCKLIG